MLSLAPIQLSFINSAGFAQTYVSIDDHYFIITALDSVDIRPTNFTPFFIFSPGQRIRALVCPKNKEVIGPEGDPQPCAFLLHHHGPNNRLEYQVCLNLIACGSSQIEKQARQGASFWIRATIYPNAAYQELQPQFSRIEGNEVRAFMRWQGRLSGCGLSMSLLLLLLLLKVGDGLPWLPSRSPKTLLFPQARYNVLGIYDYGETKSHITRLPTSISWNITYQKVKIPVCLPAVTIVTYVNMYIHGKLSLIHI